MGKAAVMTGIDQPLEIRDDVEVEAPRAGEIKVRMGASGVCHSDLSMQNGTMMAATPIVLGHEGAGVVEEVGEGVTIGEARRPRGRLVGAAVRRVLLLQRGTRATCASGANAALATGGLLDGTTRFTSQGAPLFQMAASGTFSEVTIIPAIGAVKIDDDLDMKVAALIGCGVLTGTGAALNTANINKGDTVAVVGCGGVGLNVIQGARIAGAGEIIAVDMNETKLQMAKEFGATATVNASQSDPVGQVMEMTGPARRRRGLRGHRPPADDRPDHHHDPPGRPGHPRRRPQDGRHGHGARLLRRGAGREDDQGLLVRVVQRAEGRAQAGRRSTRRASSSSTS